jgi:hypothetical protein
MKASVSFSGQLRQPKDSQVKPLTSQFFSHLIKLETDFANKTYTAETIDELVQYYAQAVEYYDYIKDQISSYFMFKIQDTLATKKSMKLLRQESVKSTLMISTPNSIANTPKSTQFIGSPTAQNFSEAKGVKEMIIPLEPLSATSASTNNTENLDASPNKSKVRFNIEVTAPEVIVETGVESTDEDEDEDEDREVQKVRKAVDMERSMRRSQQSMATMKRQKQRMFSLQLKLDQEKANQKQNLHAVLNAFETSSFYNDLVVKGDLEVQKRSFRTKLALREKKIQTNMTQNSIAYMNFKVADFTENKNMDSFLRALEEEDSNQSHGHIEQFPFVISENAIESSK